MGRRAADRVADVLEGILGPRPPLQATLWDGSRLGAADAPVHLHVRSPSVLRRLLWAPGELGLSRAYVAGELDVDGSIFDLLELRQRIADRDPEVKLDLGPRTWLRVARTAAQLGALGPPPPAPVEEARLRGGLHSRFRDRQAITHHYDVGNEFYRLVLGPSMTYSCAYFPGDDTTLEQAQDAKHELVCRKLGLRPGQRLLDVGCGWGGLAVHAASHHGVRVVGVTVSPSQASLARERVRRADLADRVDIRVADYRDVDDGPYDAIASVGMFEHVGSGQVDAYISGLRSSLRPGGRLLNHAISRPAGEGALPPDSFMARYVFPDGELQEVGRTVTALQDRGLECRDVESLREHYARTLRRWVANLEADWDRAVALVGGPRARIWRLYMAGSAIAFEGHRLSVHQVLATRTTEDGFSGMPATRAGVLAVRREGTRPAELS